MISREDIKKLANLSRIELSEEEGDGFVADIDSILGYVSQISHLPASESTGQSDIRNVFRQDNPPVGGPHESGIFTDAILAQSPRSEKGYVKVKKIISND